MSDTIVVKIDNEGNVKSVKYSEISLRNIKYMDQKTLIRLVYKILFEGLDIKKVEITNDRDLEWTFYSNVKLRLEDSYEMQYDYEISLEKNGVAEFRIRYRNEDIEFKDVRIEYYTGVIELKIKDFTVEIYAENLEEKFVKAMVAEKLNKEVTK